eukprot:6477279-Amphidinium_carterae.2
MCYASLHSFAAVGRVSSHVNPLDSQISLKHWEDQAGQEHQRGVKGCLTSLQLEVGMQCRHSPHE